MLAWQPIAPTDPDEPLPLTVDPGEMIDVATFVANTLRRPWWHAYAACRGDGPATWFPAQGESAAPARAVCATCTVREDCLADALAHGTIGLDSGVWAGTSPNERKALRRATPRQPTVCRCERCGEDFEAVQRRSRYCSKACQQAARRARVAAA